MMLTLKLAEDVIMVGNVMGENITAENIVDEVAMATIAEEKGDNALR